MKFQKKKNLHVLGEDNNEAKLIDEMEESKLLTRSLSFSTSFIFFFFFSQTLAEFASNYEA